MQPGIAFIRTPAPELPILRVGLIAVLLVVMLLGLLYAYRSQTPSIPHVDVSGALQHINAGRIRAVVVAGKQGDPRVQGQSGTPRAGHDPRA